MTEQKHQLQKRRLITLLNALLGDTEQTEDSDVSLVFTKAKNKLQDFDNRKPSYDLPFNLQITDPPVRDVLRSAQDLAARDGNSSKVDQDNRKFLSSAGGKSPEKSTSDVREIVNKTKVEVVKPATLPPCLNLTQHLSEYRGFLNIGQAIKISSQICE